MIDYIIPLVGSFLTEELVQYSICPILALSFISIVPDLIRRVIEWR